VAYGTVMCCFWCSVALCFFFQAEDGIRDATVTGVQTCALPIYEIGRRPRLPVRRHADEDLGRAERRRSMATDETKIESGQRDSRSEERRVGKECRYRWATESQKKKQQAKEDKEVTENEHKRDVK